MKLLNKIATVFGLVIVSNLVINPQKANAVELYGLTSDNTLISFTSNNPTLTTSIPITGLTGNLVGIDFRPANGDLFGVSDANQIFNINPTTGVATLISDAPTPFTLSGNSFGIDFNPNPDRIRAVSDQNQNLRLNQLTGGLAEVDSTLTYDAADVNSGTDPNIVAAAYTNSAPPSPNSTLRTTLYGIDSDLDVLVTQGTSNFLGGDPAPAVSPNTGILFTIGSLGVDFDDNSGLDIFTSATGMNTAFAVTNSTLYNINLSTGAATTLSPIGDGSNDLISVTAQTIPEPTTILGSLAALGFGIFKNKQNKKNK